MKLTMLRTPRDLTMNLNRATPFVVNQVKDALLGHSVDSIAYNPAFDELYVHVRGVALVTLCDVSRTVIVDKLDSIPEVLATEEPCV